MDKPDKLGATPLLKASSIGHAEVAQFVCRARADIDKPMTNRATPSLMASQHGHADVAQLLCAATADIDKLVFA
jgi:ankyrin repeat protein